MRWLRVVLVLGALGAAVYLFPKPFLAPIGNYLVQADQPVKSDCIFILAGDFTGKRVKTAGELYRAGYAQKVFMSGPGTIYGMNEADLAIEVARKAGLGDVPFQTIIHSANSTDAESRNVSPKLRESGCASVLVVTSNFHTRRAGRTLRRNWPGVRVSMISSAEDDFNPEAWWTVREYKKILLMEWLKTVAEWFGI